MTATCADPAYLTHPAYLTLQDASRYVGLSHWTLRDRIREGILPAHRAGRSANSRILIARHDLDNMLRPVGAATPPPGDDSTPSDALAVTLAALTTRLAAVEAALAAREG